MSSTADKNWYVYVLCCADETLYTGITTDPDRRLNEHNNSPKGASYTRGRRPVELLRSWSYRNRSEAAKAEYAFKNLSREEKIERIEKDNSIEPT